MPCGRLDVFWNALPCAEERHWSATFHRKAENAPAARRFVEMSEDEMSGAEGLEAPGRSNQIRPAHRCRQNQMHVDFRSRDGGPPLVHKLGLTRPDAGQIQ